MEHRALGAAALALLAAAAALWEVRRLRCEVRALQTQARRGAVSHADAPAPSAQPGAQPGTQPGADTAADGSGAHVLSVPELAALVVQFVDDARTLAQLGRVSRVLRAAALDDRAWQRAATRRWPVAGVAVPGGQASWRAFYQAMLEGRVSVPCQVISPFGQSPAWLVCAVYATATYVRAENQYQVEYVHGQPGRAQPWQVRAVPSDSPAEYARALYRGLAGRTDVLVRGTEVEIQWRTEGANHWDWWRGVVVGQTDEQTVLVEFTQYNPDSVWRNVPMSIDPAAPRHYPNGVSGGMRIPSARESAQWAVALAQAGDTVRNF
eukprot:TRINITY_DN2671_c0_g1_i1.p2 TRINITY_DN2671_c0_g1~~TRINITY_DN2671_c0_g1_i1.p2  ORF type:complete len:322 (+),score=58.26 TRINITY_DN2671_c0_g1_i1:11-976(+)